MKYRLRKVSLEVLGIWLIAFFAIGSITLGITSFSIFSKEETEQNNPNKDIKTETKVLEKSKKINEYVKSIPKENFVEETDINKEITNVTEIYEERYEAHLFNYTTGEEMSITDVINEGSEEAFWSKISELLVLKYPKFITSVLSLNDQRNVYIWKENELVIYFYDYEITPQPTEELYLRVNYNEIKDYISFEGKLDSTYENEDGSKIEPNKKLISLTFDDGPSGYTNNLVSILSDNHAQVTFFMLGNRLNSYKTIVKNVYDHGHEIAYHSYAHKSFKRQTIEEIQSEMNMSNEILKSITGTTFTLTRPPYGAINDEIKTSIDTTFILWNVDTEDWRYKDATYLLDYTLKHVKEGDIILFHDIHKTSVEAIEKILPELYVRGFQVVSVSTLAKNFGYTLEKNSKYSHFTK